MTEDRSARCIMADISLPSGLVMSELGEEKRRSVLKIQLPSGILVTVSEIDVNEPFCDDSSLHLDCSPVLS